MKIDEMGYVDDMRQRLGLEEGDRSLDKHIEEMDAFKRVCLLAGWHIGDGNWANVFNDWCRSQGLFIGRFDPAKLERLQTLINQVRTTDRVTDKVYFELIGFIKETLR